MALRPEDACLETERTDAVRDAPRGFLPIARALGPGLIIAGAIVGSGELIATTKTGAQGGIALLWLILLGCVVKVFVQIELGRYAISQRETTLVALNRVPGPRLGVNWVLWLWAVMMVSTIGQLGGIVGGVGQALALTLPICGDYANAVLQPGKDEYLRLISLEQSSPDSQAAVALRQRIDAAGGASQEVLARLRADSRDPLLDPRTRVSLIDPTTYDDRIWAGLVAVVTSLLLFYGRYSLIQNLSIVLVSSFTAITIGNVISLQGTTAYSLSIDEILSGLMFRAPSVAGGNGAWMTALATFGIIGVGGTELITYPYWCLEKGYGSYTGRDDGSAAWITRARGWIWVMTVDAFASLVVYTVATLAFFCMGVAVLHREGLDPSGMRMVATLAEAYVPIFGMYAKWLFLLGAIAVLYSTYLIASAGNARMITDGLRVMNVIDANNPDSFRRTLTAWSVGIPLLCFVIFCTGVNPVMLVLISGVAQAIMLPVLAFSAIYLRYRRTDVRLAPGRAWDAMLFLSAAALFVVGLTGLYNAIADRWAYLWELISRSS